MNDIWAGGVRALRALAHHWWIIASVVGLVGVGAALVDFGPFAKRVYVATESFRVVAMPSALSTYDSYLARTDEQAAARAITIGLLSSQQFASAVHGRASAAGQAATTGAIEGALSATHDGDVVTITARWETPEGATTLLSAASAELAAELRDGSLTPAGSAYAGLSLRMDMTLPPGGSVLDPAAQRAAWRDLAVRLAGALCAGVLLAALAAWVQRRRPAYVDGASRVASSDSR